MIVFERQPRKLPDLSKKIIGLHFDSLNDAIPENNDRDGPSLQKMRKHLAEAVGVIEVCGNVVRPSWPAVAALLWVSIADCFDDVGEFRHLKRQWNRFGIANRLPKLPKALRLTRTVI